MDCDSVSQEVLSRSGVCCSDDPAQILFNNLKKCGEGNQTHLKAFAKDLMICRKCLKF